MKKNIKPVAASSFEVPDAIKYFFIKDPERQIQAPNGYIYVDVVSRETFEQMPWMDKIYKKNNHEKGRSGESLGYVFVGLEEVLKYIIQEYTEIMEDEKDERLIEIARDLSVQIGFDFEGVEAKAINKKGRSKDHKKGHEKEKKHHSGSEKKIETRLPVKVTDGLPIIKPTSAKTVSEEEVIRELILNVPSNIPVRSIDGEEIRIGPGEIPVCEICSPNNWEEGVLWWIIKGKPKIYGKPTSTWEMLGCREIQP